MKARRIRLQLEPLEPRSLLAAGALDTTFGNQGFVTTGLTSSGGDTAEAIVIQPSNGDIIVGGDTGGQTAMGLARYTSSGSLDPTFGSGGKLLLNQGAGVRSLALQSNGDLIVGGFGGKGMTIARLTPSGALDSTFGKKGIVTVETSGVAWGVAIQPDGKIVTVGAVNGTTNCDFYVSRFNADGSVDKSFGSAGSVVTNVNGHYDQAQAVAIQPNGAIVVAGFADSTGSYHQVAGTGQFAAVRYNPNGGLDQTFGTGGIVVTSLNGNATLGSRGVDAEADDVIVQPDGKIVLTGGAYSTLGHYFALVRYNSDGSLDTTFGTGGESVQTATSGVIQASGLGLEPDGKIVVAGAVFQAPYGNEVAVYNPDGSLDSTFGGTGVVTTPDPNGKSGGAYALAIQPADDNIVTAGVLNGGNGPNSAFFLARYISDSPVLTTSTTTRSPAALAGTIAPDASLAPLVLDIPDLWDSLSVKKRTRST